MSYGIQRPDLNAMPDKELAAWMDSLKRELDAATAEVRVRVIMTTGDDCRATWGTTALGEQHVCSREKHEGTHRCSCGAEKVLP